MKKVLNLLAALAIVSMVMVACEKTPVDNNPGSEQGGETGGEDKPDKLAADFTYEANGLEITFTNGSTGASSFLWDFGDGTNSSEKSPKHTYTAAGDYTVRLTVANDDGETAKKEQVLTVAGAVKAYFSHTAQTDRTGKFGKVVSFDATSSENAASIVWDFGDGTITPSGTDFQISHEFPDYGNYKVKATVTGISGDTDEFEADIEVVAYNELLKGGSMEAEDAQYWTFKDYWATNSNYETVEGTPAFVAEFGCKTNVPSGGEGGCLRLGGENQVVDGSYTASFYQAIEVVEGDVLEISASMKWGDRAMDNGVLFWCISETVDDFGSDATAILQQFNWWSVGDTGAPVPVPAFDGDFSGAGLADYGYSGDGSSTVTYTATKTGTIYFGAEVRSVWGTCYGAGADFYFDNLSVKIIL